MDSYLPQIEEAYARCRGCRSMLSPIDWHLAQGWQDSGIPIHIVLRAMADCCDAFHRKRSPGKINALKYFDQEVRKQYDGWLQSRVGANDSAGTNGEQIQGDFKRPETIELLNFRAEMIELLQEFTLKFEDAKSRTPAELHCWVDFVSSSCRKILAEVDRECDIEKVETALKTTGDLFNQAIMDHYSFSGSDTDRLLFLKAKYHEFSLPRLTLYEL
jgi:hypothetical protein